MCCGGYFRGGWGGCLDPWGIGEGIIEGVDGVGDFLIGGAEWGHEDDGIADGSGEESVLACADADVVAHAFIGGPWLVLGWVFEDIDGGDESELAWWAEFIGVFVVEGVEEFFEGVDFGGEGGEGIFGGEEFEVGEGDGAAERVGAVAMAVVEGVFGAVEERSEDILGGEGGGEGEGAAGEAFGEAEEVGGDVFVLAGEHFSGAAESGHDFVEDEEDVMLVAPVAQAGEHA